MKHKLFYLTLLVAVVLSFGSVGVPSAQAQEELDTVLARAAAKGFLVGLTRPELSGIMDFYVLDSIDLAGVVTDLQDVTGYEISGGDWVSDVTFQTRAVLQPGDREINVYTGKYGGRWQVEGVDLPTASISDGDSANDVILAQTGGGAIPVAGNGTGRLLFQTQNGGDIYLVNADGTGLQRITNGMDPQLSPDGSQITFTRWEPQYELFTINTDGTGERAWAGNWRQMKSPTWTADGSKLVFSWQNGGQLDAIDRRINLKDAFIQGDKVEIPDRARGVEVKDGILKYTLPADAYWNLKEVNLNTGQLTDLPSERHSYGPTGHPTQANQVVFRGDRGVALHDLESGIDQPVTGDGRDHTPVISPDSSKIVVSYWQDDHWEIHTMNIDGSNRQRLTSTPLSVLVENRQLTSEVVDGKERFVASENPAWNNAAPVWSPDGSQIAFVTDRTGRWEIWIMNADGSNQRPMFPNGVLDGVTLTYAGVDERMLSWR